MILPALAWNHAAPRDFLRQEERGIDIEVHDLEPRVGRMAFRPVHPTLLPALFTRMSMSLPAR